MNACRPESVIARGFSLVELMVALAITMALSTGMLSMLMSTRINNSAQSQLEQLQEDQRLLLTRLTDAVQNAGYFPNPQTSTLAAELPATGSFSVAGQGLVGTSASSGDTLVVRYEAGTTDGVMDCSGKTNTGTSPLVMVNTFSLDSSGFLDCTVNGVTTPLAGGVKSFTVLYGVDTSASGASTQYIAASAMTAANWANIYSVRVTLTFLNPLAGQAGQPAALPALTQVIPVLNLL